ncbi:hypothetical protein G7Z17_g12324 [Cylindrodendrum hubeiense]|uniref:Ubiquinone biosynthesis O-methyltransferase, mitochondrial n=1 Tax=Cylindrodendrum hubeiense TaxID=595255 RepID=A0A9P5H284_9HYPO|nr:hypothetical protein G7Z17_g12324 [Cylindrodendrum hubeiense]
MSAPSRPAGVLLRRLSKPNGRLLSSSTVPRASSRVFPGPVATSSAARWNSTTTSSSTSSTSTSSSSNFSSVNPDEVSHFNELAADWWDPHGSSRLLHLMNPLRHDFIRACHHTQADPPPSNGLTYLDIGCGGGIFAESAARLPSTRSVTAIDPTPSVLAIAKAHARKDPSLRNKLQYRQTSIEQLTIPTEEEAYDIVSLFEVIEHVDQPGAVLERVRPFVKPGGWLVMSTIARTWVSWFTTNFMAEDVLGIVPKGTHDWNKYLNEGELRGFLAGRGWSSPMVQGVMYVPGLGWKEVQGSERVGNYFFAVRKI